jgi:hypothetical protein
MPRESTGAPVLRNRSHRFRRQAFLERSCLAQVDAARMACEPAAGLAQEVEPLAGLSELADIGQRRGDAQLQRAGPLAARRLEAPLPRAALAFRGVEQWDGPQPVRQSGTSAGVLRAASPATSATTRCGSRTGRASKACRSSSSTPWGSRAADGRSQSRCRAPIAASAREHAGSADSGQHRRSNPVAPLGIRHARKHNRLARCPQ